MTGRKKSNGAKDKSRNLKEVQTCQGFVEAEVIRSYLESNGIKCVFRGRGAQSILPQTTNGLGEIKVFVLENDLPLALELLKALKKESK